MRSTRSARAPRCVLAVAVWAAAALLPRAAAEPEILRFDDVQAGMKGHGRSVFHGTAVETFDVEILGKLPNVGPGQNLILARCSGGPLAETGILAGMSGSPVLVGDKLVGAVAYSWGFSKDAIAGITPIEEMLAVAALPAGPARRAASVAAIDGHALEPLFAPAGLAEFFEHELATLLGGTTPLRATAVPLSLSGFSPAGLARAGAAFERAGFVPVQVGGSGGAAATGSRIEPGSAIGLQLVRGAVEITAVGTATWVEGDSVIGFGHPLFGLGGVDLPITGADVQALLPSVEQSVKIATPLGEVGALTQDRAAGVAGRLGRAPRMIPVRLALTGAEGARSTFSFEIADDPLLSPLLLYVSLNGILSSRERAFGDATVRLAGGSVIQRAEGENVALDNLFAGPTASDYGTGIAAYVLHLLMNNTWSQPRISGVNLILEYDTAPRVAHVRRVSVDRYRVRPGETLTASVVIEPFRGPQRTLTRELRIPESTPAGELLLYVGSASATSQLDDGYDRARPESLDQLVRLINQLRRNDQVYLVGTMEDAGAMVAGTRLPGLPPSVARVLSRPRSSGNFAFADRRAVLEATIATDYAVEGGTRLQLEVLGP